MVSGLSVFIMTINNAFNQIAAVVAELILIIDREIGAMEMLDNTGAKSTFIEAKNELQASTGGSGFAGGVRMLNAINTCAKAFEERSCTESETPEYWLYHAYEFRRSAEHAATDLLHTVGCAPQFERSLAGLRISCAYLAKQLGYRDATMRFAQGALRLAAPESDIELVRKVMQPH
jgi:hypothetical protein